MNELVEADNEVEPSNRKSGVSNPYPQSSAREFRMPDLGDIFARRKVSRATDTFTDRVSERDAFRDAFESHVHAVRGTATGFEFQERNNVLAFHGIGGIGKTTLSRTLERWVLGASDVPPDWPPPPRVRGPVITTRLDFDERSKFDVRDCMLGLRATAGASGVPLKSFDLAFRMWWMLASDGEPLPDVPVRGSSFSKEVGPRLGDQIRDSATSALDEIGAPLGSGQFTVRLLQFAISRLRGALNTRAARQNPNLAAALESVATEPNMSTLAFLPGLLTWDLRQAPADRRPTWIVFVDTFEILNGSNDRSRERLFQRMVLSLPDVLWVVSGRNRLDWSDDRLHGLLERVGQETWPGLAVGSRRPRQHLVGDMSQFDARRFLERSIGHILETESPIYEAVVAESNGVPLYLDFAVERVVDLLDRQVALTVESVAMSFPALLNVFVRDLPEDERLALQGACLFPRFDAGLAAAAGGCSTGAAERLALRPFVRRHDWPNLPLTIHNLVREAVRSTDVLISGGWASEDWLGALRRALVELGRRHTEDLDAERRLDYFQLGMGLAYETGEDPGWLLRAAGQQPTMRTAAIAMPPVPTGCKQSWAAGLHGMLSCWLEDSSGRPRHERLAEFIEERKPPTRVLRSARRFQAYNLRDNDNPKAALAIFDNLLATGSESKSVHKYQRGITLVRLGRYPEAEVCAGTLADGPGRQTKRERIVGLLNFWHGHLELAGDAAHERAKHLQQKGAKRVAAENYAFALSARAFIDPDVASEALKLAEESEAGSAFDVVRSAFCWRAVACSGNAGLFDLAMSDLELSFTSAAIDAGDASLRYRLHLPTAFHAAVLGDVDRVVAAFEEIPQSSGWTRICEFWLADLQQRKIHGEPDRAWLEPEDVVRARWVKVVHDRRAV